MTHPVRLIIVWRDAIEAAARRADIAVHGPFTQDANVHIRRVRTLHHLKLKHPTQRKWLLRRLALFDKATAHGDALGIQRHGTLLVECWKAAAQICATVLE